MRIERLSPRRSCIREKNIDMICCLRYFADEVLYSFGLCTVGRDGDGFCAWGEVGEGIQGFDCCFAGGCFAGCDIDF